ncbi:DNA polymerase III subunit delta' [Oryzifoliimicrobium ureilyticus]|uniref:DNA polymerase III subunit delta' n=1 Tax=Oryzifoliimicrobium ureilyticus TaxID=3113724 RepID=UPI003075F459
MSDNKPGLLDGAIAPWDNNKLFGHQDAETFLAETYRSGKGHHAILIEGPPGIGKATLAFRFANHVLSHPDPVSAPVFLADPDPAAPISRQIASGASHHLLHLTRPFDEKTGRAKSAITVDEVRRAGRFFSQTSGTGNWRIVIIDPADDMNRNAANAILKILEEPPKRAMFLVLSHAPGRLLPTIRSRCLSLNLAPLTERFVADVLEHLGLGPADPKLLELAQGSAGEALKLINYGGADIVAAYREVFSSPGPAARKAMHRLADALSGKDSETIFDFFVSHIGDDLMQKARAAAYSGDVSKAEQLSRLWSSATERFLVADSYNLDRKQTIIGILGDIRSAVA